MASLGSQHVIGAGGGKLALSGSLITDSANGLLPVLHQLIT